MLGDFEIELLLPTDRAGSSSVETFSARHMRDADPGDQIHEATEWVRKTLERHFHERGQR